MPNYLQMVLIFRTMLSNFIPLSLYVSEDIITNYGFDVFWELNMLDAEMDTPTMAHITIVMYLGLVEYIASNKMQTLTCNVIQFKRFSVDGQVFGMPIA